MWSSDAVSATLSDHNSNEVAWRGADRRTAPLRRTDPPADHGAAGAYPRAVQSFSCITCVL